MTFETKCIAFFGAKLRCFLPHLRSSAKAMLMRRYYSRAEQ